MRFSDTFLEEIRQRLPISQVVGEYVQWDRRKSQPARGDYWACCPFHGEKTPSFHADDRRGRYHCFGCGASGGHFRFLTEHGGLRFPEAVEKLAGEAGVPMPARDARAEKQDRERASLYDVMELAASYFEAALAHNIGARARGYLAQRGVSHASQSRFRIGFAPDSRNGLKEHLAANGVSGEQMAAAGLVVHGEGIAVPYDRFRNRVMFPITDFRGRVIAFGGRALDPQARAKYLNSPETELFHKRRTLYNGQMAQKNARNGQPVVVMEGYLDVIAGDAAGFGACVAPLGTALSEEHVALLWRMSDQPVLCFDGDAAGQRAMARTTEIVLPLLTPGKSVRVATLPEGTDPDDLIREQGAAAFAQLVESAVPLSEAVWNLETAGGVPGTPEGRAALEERLADRVRTIQNSAINRHYFQAFNERLKAFFALPEKAGGGSYRGTRRGGGGAKRQSGRPAVGETLRNSRLLRAASGGGVTSREAVILTALVNHPRLAQARIERLAQVEFSSPLARRMLSVLVDQVTGNPSMSGGELVAALQEQGFGPDMERMREMLEKQGVWQIGAEIDESDARTGLNHALALHYKSVELNRELKAAELALGQAPSEESFERLRDIQNQITSVDGTEALIEGFGLPSGRAAPSF